MAKRLVVCCDGTWNTPDQTTKGKPTPTNVAKVAMGLASHDEQGESSGCSTTGGWAPPGPTDCSA
ncbi:phospholipase effector Tle1 domain-containing protein [Mycobacterium sp. DL440]|uniref:phospholipase effector Tle1 domain-containing protein n=1 Tax=Mycobacterium sp. DL440 TaxID=2675523 RepID=UPI001FB9BE4A|nr:DUF2235 domain-containing protein [Mycobacterium sp. DL440]